MHGIRRLILLALVVLSSPTASGAGNESPRFWGDTWRGWHFYEDPVPEAELPRPVPPKPAAPPATARDPRRAARPPELIDLERLRQQVEDLRGIAVMRPTEANVRRYMELEAKVVAQASTFADVAQRVAWTTPELDPTLQGRPVNAKALEVFEAQQMGDRSRSIAELGRDHVLLFFFRGDCPYCHAFAPTLEAFQGRHGIRVEAVSLDGGVLPGFASARRDNGAASALRVAQVPAVYLAQPFTGRIVPIGFGVLSESQLLERISAAAAPAFEAMVPSAVRQLGMP
ncbi:MAG: conjugal transfer protein TraF [Piscinibacter sp.]|uniref:conjugal transfer protein TraF n=1 Tax=Piscinibacter TaxID=1114981 RepID=UPI000FDD1732|nr:MULTISPECIES: conjugal transfer protein TraF [Piscinibacter]MCW5663639.1 conjugal transfer protein TraF [Piscinibacter sp.]